METAKLNLYRKVALKIVLFLNRIEEKTPRNNVSTLDILVKIIWIFSTIANVYADFSLRSE
jgi:hypothetical protein